MNFFNKLGFIKNIESFLDTTTNVIIFSGLVAVVSLLLYIFSESKMMRVFPIITLVLSSLILFCAFKEEAKLALSFPVENMAVLQETIKESPLRALLGSGPGTVQYQYDLYAPEETPTRSWSSSLLIQFGLLGGFAWIVFFILFLYFGIWSFLEKNALAIGNFIVALYLWIFALLYPVNFTLVAFTFLFTGICITLQIIKDSENKIIIPLQKRSSRVVFACLVGIVLFTSTLGIIVYTKKSISYAFYQNALVIESKELFLDTVKRALQISKEDIYYRKLADFYIKKTEMAQGLVLFTEQNKKIVEYGGNAVSYANEAVRINPSDYRNWGTLGNIYLVFERLGVRGGYELGKNAYSEAQKLSPKNEILLLERAELAFLAKDIHFRELLKELLQYNPHNIEAQKRLREWGL
ncbi:MAG: hypothetical protein HYT93_00105 [Parcubacteria group bacterium]|nr:hypothetical protein [Parcubacteria group bacterium]